MNKLLDPLQNGMINLPGAHQLTLVGIDYAGGTTLEEFEKHDRAEQVVDHFHAWLGGDVAIDYVRHATSSNPSLTVGTALADYAKARGKELETVKKRYNVALAFKIKARTSLSWSHHATLYEAGVTGEPAIDWLKRATKYNWSRERLRAELKRELRPAVSSEPAIHGWFAPELQAAVDYVSGRLEEVDEMPIEQVGALLREAQPLVDYVDRLRARLAPPVGSLLPQPRG